MWQTHEKKLKGYGTVNIWSDLYEKHSSLIVKSFIKAFLNKKKLPLKMLYDIKIILFRNLNFKSCMNF